jgi:hypothetical protein
MKEHWRKKNLARVIRSKKRTRKKWIHENDKLMDEIERDEQENLALERNKGIMEGCRILEKIRNSLKEIETSWKEMHGKKGPIG